MGSGMAGALGWSTLCEAEALSHRGGHCGCWGGAASIACLDRKLLGIRRSLEVHLSRPSTTPEDGKDPATPLLGPVRVTSWHVPDFTTLHGPPLPLPPAITVSAWTWPRPQTASSVPFLQCVLCRAR